MRLLLTLYAILSFFGRRSTSFGALGFAPLVPTSCITSSSAASFVVTTTTTTSAGHPYPCRYPMSSTTTALFMVADEIEEIYMDTEDRMSKSVDSVKKNLNTVRTGRANPNMLDRVSADYYGVLTPLNQMATIAVPSSQQLSVAPFDKSMLTDIEKAIIEAELGLSCNNDGNVIRINIPELTEDRRKEMLKQCKSIGEDGKVAIRNVRRDGVEAIKKLEKAKTVGQDEMLDGIDEVQKLTDQHTREIDDIVARKEKEVMTV